MVVAEVQLLHLQLSGITEHRLTQDSRGSNQQYMNLLNHFQQHFESKGNTLSTVQHVKNTNCGINLAKWQQTVNNYTARSLAFLLPAKYCMGDQRWWDGWDMWHVRRRRETHRVLIGQLEAKMPLGRHGRSWEDIKMELNRKGRGMH